MGQPVSGRFLEFAPVPGYRLDRMQAFRLFTLYTGGVGRGNFDIDLVFAVRF